MNVPRTNSDRRNCSQVPRPRVQRDDRASGSDHAARRPGRRPAGVEPHDGCALEDPDAAFDERVAEAAREPGRVDGRGVGDAEAGPNHRRVEAVAELALGDRPIDVAETQPLGLRHGLPDGGVVRGVGRHAEVAGRFVPGVDALVFAPGADLVDRTRRHLDGSPAGRPVALEQQMCLVVQPVHEPAVAAARSAAADVALEQDDVQGRLALLEEPRGPHPRVPAAEDHDVGGGVSFERFRLGPREPGQRERLLEPPAPSGGSGDAEVGQRGPRL